MFLLVDKIYKEKPTLEEETKTDGSMVVVGFNRAKAE